MFNVTIKKIVRDQFFVRCQFLYVLATDSLWCHENFPENLRTIPKI